MQESYDDESGEEDDPMMKKMKMHPMVRQAERMVSNEKKKMNDMQDNLNKMAGMFSEQMQGVAKQM